jgi:hypothetical protein
MHGVNIAASTAFWQNAPPTPSDVREAVALSLQPSRSRTPRPRVGSSITPTTLRPSVLVCSYGPPSGGQEWQVELEKKKISRLSSLQVLRRQIRSLVLDTRSNYDVGLLRFTQFCDSLNIPERDRMPVAESWFLYHSIHSLPLSSC